MSSLPRVFTVAQARELGVEERLLRSSREFDHPYRGLRATAEATWLDLARGRVRAAGPSATLFGLSALRAWGLERPGASAVDDTLHLAVPRPSRAPRGAGVAGYSVTLRSSHVTSWQGIPITTRARTWIDLARWLGVAELVAVGDRLCSPEDDWCSPSELASAVDSAPQVRGIRRLREALDLVQPGAESYPESQLRVALVQGGLPAPLVNAVVRDGVAFVARVDMLFAAYGVIVEYEGARHAEDRRQWRRDLTRIGELQRLGYIVERAHAGDLRDPRALIARVRTHLERRGWRA